MHKLLILVVIIILIFILNLKTYENFNQNIQSGYKKWYQCKKYKNINKIFQKVLNDNGIKRVFDDSWDIYLHCNNFNKKSFDDIKISSSKQILEYIPGNGVLGSKQFIWKMLTKKYGRDKSAKIMPPSYIFPKDKDIFLFEFRKNKTYVLKSEKQRQKGIKLSNSSYEILNSNKKGFKIVQEYIKNPLTYNGYKLNFRIYILVVRNNKNDSCCYVYDDGIVSYSNEQVDETTINFQNGVSSFYTSKNLYKQGYPITLKQFMNTEKGRSMDWYSIRQNFNKQIYKTMDAAKDYIGSYNFSFNNKSFQLFGVDFLLTNDMKSFILEINIGPGMSNFNSIDSDMRYKLHEDILKTIDVLPNTNNHFTKIWKS